MTVQQQDKTYTEDKLYAVHERERQQAAIDTIDSGRNNIFGIMQQKWKS